MRQIGEIVDGLGVNYDDKEGDLYSAAVVILKVHTQDGSTVLRTIWSDNISWIEKIGMLKVAYESDIRDIFEEVE